MLVGGILIYAAVCLLLGGTTSARPALYLLLAGWLVLLLVLHFFSRSKAPAFELVAANIAFTLLRAELSLRAFAAVSGQSLLLSDTLQAHKLTPGHDYGHGLIGNSLGYPGRDYPVQKSPGTFRIAALVAFLGVLTPVPGAPAWAAEPIRILAFGDSLTAGYGLAEQDTLPTRLADALNKMGRPVTMINGGVSGDTTADGLSRIDWALADKPQIMILALGANDMLRGIDPGSTRANLEGIIEKARDAGVEIVLAGMLAPPNLGADYKQAFDGIYPALAKAHNLVFMPFLLQDVAQVSDLNQGDGIHPNGKGVAVIVRNLLPYVTEAMDKAAGAS